MKRREIMRKSRIVSFTKYFLDFMFYSGILVVLSLPYTLKLAGKYYPEEFGRQYWTMLAIFAASGVCGLIIVFSLRKMIKTVLDQDCFVDENTGNLKIMGQFYNNGAFHYKISYSSNSCGVCDCSYFLYRRYLQPCSEPCV